MIALPLLMHNVNKRLVRGAMRALGPDVTSVVVGVGCGFAGPFAPLCYAGASYDMTRAFGGSSSQALRSGVIAAFSSYVGGQIGTGSYGQTFGQAVLGGVVAELQGGKFGHGFASAGLTAMVMPQIGARFDTRGGRMIAGAIAGGTISAMTGGKFANGAISGAMMGAMMGSTGKTRLEAGDVEEYWEGNFSDAPNGKTQLALLDAEKRYGVVLDEFERMYTGSKDRVRFRRNDVSTHGVIAEVEPSILPWRKPTIYIYNRIFEYQSYWAIKTTIDHEMFHYHFHIIMRGAPRNLHEVRAVDYQMSRPAWNNSPEFFRRAMINYRTKFCSPEIRGC